MACHLPVFCPLPIRKKSVKLAKGRSRARGGVRLLVASGVERASIARRVPIGCLAVRVDASPVVASCTSTASSAFLFVPVSPASVVDFVLIPCKDVFPNDSAPRARPSFQHPRAVGAAARGRIAVTSVNVGLVVKKIFTPPA